MRVLVLGGYGLIGLSICKALAAAGHEVIGLGRDAARGRRLLPGAAWIGADIARLTGPGDWTAHLEGVDAVVNASGALQDGAKDRLSAVQRDAIAALIAACERAGTGRFIQISAPGAAPDASTAFMRTKGEADAILRASGVGWTIFKPGLVLAETAYGGTALVRTLAAFPLVQPMMHGRARMQTVDVLDVADAVAWSLSPEGTAATRRREFDLVEDEAHALADIVAAFRAWLGFPPARMVIETPAWLGYSAARLADLAGWLGWRSPLRTTSLKVLETDVVGDPEPWRAVRGRPLASLADTLARLVSSKQERRFARTELVLPLLTLTLAGFWIASGAIGLWRLDAAAAIVADRLGEAAARMAVLAGSALDLLIGAALLVRPLFGWALAGAAAVSLSYLALGTVLAPQLWADPLGPFVKIAPALALVAAVWSMGDAR